MENRAGTRIIVVIRDRIAAVMEVKEVKEVSSSVARDNGGSGIQIG